jgi:hypothetical protein
VFDRAGAERAVRNALVIGRIWADMDDYQADVLVAASQHDDQCGMEETILAAAKVVAEVS